MRELIEFECNDCNGFFTVNLNLSINGNFLFVCPQCGRQHPRSVEKGQMNGKIIERIYNSGEGKRIRRNSMEGVGDRIIVPKSAYRKVSKLKEIEEARGGFLAQAWANLTKHQTQQEAT
jgi:predicted metal-binding protein